jgi:DNA helicase-2/ATP-dependent DNA helicase PcrA
MLFPVPPRMTLPDELNPQQQEAVAATEGPVLVLAGAGSGKTRVITYRVARLIAAGHPAPAILCVTFTNKAADQMRQRVERLLQAGGVSSEAPWSGTFHAFCARLLRREAPRLGLRRDFAIYDDDDQLRLVRELLRQQGFDDRSYNPRDILSRISYAKNGGRTAEDLATTAFDDKGRVAARIFALYQPALRRNGALDFDDLLLLARDVLRDHPEARRTWSTRFRYVQVDEYQDTNRIQYELVRQLSAAHRNLCVVGDEDQSIYSWRGADVGNILRFEQDFPGARILRLEQNYRSTQNILDAAAAVVGNNQRRLGKTLTATRGAGSNLKYFEGADAAAEAEYVGQQAQGLLRGELQVSLAVLYRTNFQSRAFEEALRRRGIRYRVVGGFSFYKRAEVKDTLAYVRLAMNPGDDIALLRVLNVPPRGIGPKALAALRECAEAEKLSLWDAVGRLAGNDAARGLRSFRALIEGLRPQVAALPPAEFLQQVLDRSGYLTMLEQQDFAEDSSRVENVRELVNAVTESTQQGETLADFLDRTALVSDADDYDEAAQVTLMTLHSAKGLEFDHVFLTGLEEGLFPHSRSRNSAEELEEERRLCYVGMTRARNTLTLTRALYRRIFGNELTESSLPSRFLAEIPDALLDLQGGSQIDAGGGRRYVPDPEFEMSDYGHSRYPAARRFSSSAPRRSPVRRADADDVPVVQRGAFGAPARSAKRNALIGARVRHPKFGEGTVLAVEEDEGDRTLTVSFAGYGAKRLKERFAHLERL